MSGQTTDTPETDAWLDDEGTCGFESGYKEMCDIARNLERQRNALYEALKLLHDNQAEYIRINHLGGYDNYDMRMARAALALIESKGN